MESNRTTVPYIKRRDSYYRTRREELKERLAELEHFRPVCPLYTVAASIEVELQYFHAMTTGPPPPPPFIRGLGLRGCP